MFHHCDGVHLLTTNSSKTASLTKISGIIWATAIYGWLLMINVHRAIETRLTLPQLAIVELFIPNTNTIDSTIISSLYGRTQGWGGVGGWKPFIHFKKCSGRDHNAYHYFNRPPELEMYGCVITRGSRVEMDGHIFLEKNVNLERFQVFDFPGFLQFDGRNLSSHSGMFEKGTAYKFAMHQPNRAADRLL
ncbi:hypothetical protein CEXT_694841 [Caerostris extrusa]|uniref:Uncharacterized protein n=1 Tax=Caerostris extrusa TaxID=172846 RepID=A0AAV4QFP7_CAEEX|nr:hypothetical protein CEXT_694841 [Caerostris extrusa]